MDDLVVIILTLVIAGFGLLGQIKKQKQNQQNAGTTDKPNDIWDLFNPDMETAYDETVHDLYETPVEETVESFKTPTYQFDARSEGDSLIKSRKDTKSMEIKTTLREGKDFSLKKAVIYSEILNRKYI